jgi:hypothetical protein
MPSFISFRGRRYYEPSVVVDVNNNLITPEAGQKSLCVVGDFPELPKGVTHTFGPSQQFEASDLYPRVKKIRNYDKIFKNSIVDSNASASSLTFVNVGVNTPGEQTIVDAAGGGGSWTLKSKYYGVAGNDIQIRLEDPDTPAADPLNQELSVTANKYKMIIRNNGFEDVIKRAGFPDQLKITYTDDNAQEGRFCKIEILPLSSVQSIRVSKFDDDSDNALIQAVIDKEAEITAKEAEIAAKTVEILVLDADDDGTAENGANQAALDILIAERVTLNSELTTLQGELTVAETARDAAIDVITRPLSDFAKNTDLAAWITGLDDRLLAEWLNEDAAPEFLDNGTFDFADVANAAVSHTLHAHTYAMYLKLQDIDVPFTVELDALRGYFALDAASDNLDGANPIFQRFAGGTQAAGTAADYLEVLELLEDKDFTTMCVQSTQASIHQFVKNFSERSLDLHKERNYILPAAADLQIADIFSTYVRPLNSPRFSIVGQKIDYTGYDGAEVRGDTKDMAFLMMCIQGAVAIAKPLTLMAPNITNVYQEWNRERDNDNVIKAGILAIGKDLKIARSITTWQTDNLTEKVEMSALESVDTTVRELRKVVYGTLGEKILTSTKNNLKKLVIDTLGGFQADGYFKEFKNVVVSIEDDTSFVSFDLAVAKPHNFSYITINLI